MEQTQQNPVLGLSVTDGPAFEFRDGIIYGPADKMAELAQAVQEDIEYQMRVIASPDPDVLLVRRLQL